MTLATFARRSGLFYSESSKLINKKSTRILTGIKRLLIFWCRNTQIMRTILLSHLFTILDLQFFWLQTRIWTEERLSLLLTFWTILKCVRGEVMCCCHPVSCWKSNICDKLSFQPIASCSNTKKESKRKSEKNSVKGDVAKSITFRIIDSVGILSHDFWNELNGSVSHQFINWLNIDQVLAMVHVILNSTFKTFFPSIKSKENVNFFFVFKP